METFLPIEFSTYIHKSRAEVYRSLISLEGWNGCFTTGATIELEKKEIYFQWKDLGPEKISAEVKARDVQMKEDTMFGFTWHHDSLPCPTNVSIELTSKGEGTIVKVKDEGYPKTEKGEFMFMDCAAGWAEFLTLLKFYLETGYRYKNW